VAGLDPAIHAFFPFEGALGGDVGGRNKSGHRERYGTTIRAETSTAARSRSARRAPHPNLWFHPQTVILHVQQISSKSAARFPLLVE
jgi:hypothetical protein